MMVQYHALFVHYLVTVAFSTLQFPTWNTTVPNLKINASGGLVPIIQNNFTIYNASLPDGSPNPNGTYNHGPMPIYWQQHFYVSWYNAPQNESQYMRVLFAISSDNEHWNPPIEAFPNYTIYGQQNLAWFISPISNNLYISCALFHNTIRTPLMRQIIDINKMGDIFWMSSTLPKSQTISNKTFLDMNNITTNDIEIYMNSLLITDNVPNSDTNQRFEGERSMYLIPNTTENRNGSYSQRIMLLLRGSDYNLWASSCIRSFNDQTILTPSNKLFYCRPGTDIAYINAVNILSEKSINITDCEWSKPIITNIVDSPARTCLGQLPDHRVYYLGNPTAHNRTVLVLAISNDGLTFSNAYAVRYNPPPRKYYGEHKDIGFQYPSAMWMNQYMYITYSVNKEDIQISKINELSLYHDSSSTRNDDLISMAFVGNNDPTTYFVDTNSSVVFIVFIIIVVFVNIPLCCFFYHQK